MNTTRHQLARERGQVVLVFALLLPVLLAMSGAVIGIGNWYVHAKNLQTKADAGAFAGGNAWSFPCSSNTDTTIANQARLFAGPTSAPPVASTGGYNPQVGGVVTSKIHAVLNGPDWYDDDENPLPSEFTSPAGPVCAARILDVKMTEDNSFPLASLIPLFPDLKRKARVQIEEGNNFSQQMLPIAVRVPKPVSAAALYINQTPGPNFGSILSARYFNDICEPQPPPGYTDCLPSIPSGLDQWKTDDGSGGNRADISSMPAQVGVVVAVSVRAKCPGPAPCFSINPTTYPTADAMCNQGSGIVQCYYTTVTSGTQTVRSGLQFIRGYSTNADPFPDLLGVWFDTPSGTNCYQGYFSAPVANPCDAVLHANIDPGFGGTGSSEIRYKLVSGNTSWQEDDAPGPCNNNFGANCVLTGNVASVEFNQAYARHAVAISIYRYNIPLPVVVANGLPPECALPTPQQACSWYYTGAGRSMTDPSGASGAATIFANPVQQSFMGNIDRSGPVKFLHLYYVDCTTGATLAGFVVTGDAASVPQGRRCFQLDMGLQGALAREQDEYPIQLNIGATSQSAVVDCDPSVSNLKDEIVQGCGGDDGEPTYARHDFANLDPATGRWCPTVSGANQFFSLPKPFPWDKWEPFTCVLTQTSSTPNQVIDGFDERFFGTSANPSCPADNAQFVRGRNYWHDLNNEFFGDPDGAGPEPVQNDYFTFTRSSRNHGNHLRNDDPRFVLLFITPYNSFTGQGNETYPITLIGGFYITGYGTINGSGAFTNEDPCSTGSGGAVGAGNSPPPDLDTSTAGAVAWGHFVVSVDLGTSGGGTGQLCEPGTPTACVAVLVE
jgi:Putative Flp pilus-assembly TadE/G-like